MADVVNLGNIQIANAVSVVYTAGDNITISDDRVISATVPTKTSDLTNDSGYITNETDGLVNYTTTNQMDTLLSAKADKNSVYTKTESDSRYPLSSNVYSKTESDSKYSTIPETGNKIEVSINSSTYVITMNLKDKNNNILSTGTVDLPLESVVVSGRYDSATKMVILTLQNGSTIEFSVADLISGLQETLIAGDNIQINGNTISATDTTYTAGENVTITGTTISAKDTTYELSGETEDDVTTLTLEDSDGGTSTATVDCSKYQEELDTLNEIVDGLPHVDGKGTELSLSPTIKAPLKSTLKGNATQTTYTGKNLFNLTGVSETSVATYADGIITLNWSGGFDCYLLNNATQYLTGLDTTKTYTISFKHTGNRIVLKDQLTSTTVTTNVDTNYVTYSFNITGVSQIRLDIIRSDTTGTASVKEVMVEEGSSATSYEPYVGGVASPNPDYPQKVKVVTGDNTVKIEGKNLVNLKNDTKTSNGIQGVISNGIVTLSGTTTANAFIRLDNDGINYYFDKLKAGTYTLSANNNQALGTGDYLRFVAIESVDTTPEIRVPLNSLNSSYTFTLNEDLTNVVLQIRIANPRTLTGFVVKPQLEYGSTATIYESYTGDSYPINLGVVNMYNKDNGEAGGISLTDGSYTDNVNNWRIKDYIEIDSSKIYTFNLTNRSSNYILRVYYYDVNKNFMQVEQNSNTAYTFTPIANSKFIKLGIYLPNTVMTQSVIDTILPQLEEGTTASSYSPYGVAPIELCKIGDYQDYFYKENGNWYKKMCVRHLSLPIASMNNGVNYPGWKNLEVLKDDIPNANTTLIGATDYYASITKNDNGLIRINTTTVEVLYLSRSIIDLPESDWKTTYPNLVLELYYGLPTPVIEQITNSTLISQLNAIEKATSYKTQTNLSSMYNTDNAQMIISASALYDLSALIGA